MDGAFLNFSLQMKQNINMFELFENLSSSGQRWISSSLDLVSVFVRKENVHVDKILITFSSSMGNEKIKHENNFNAV